MLHCRIFSRSDSHFTFLLHTRQRDNIICLDLQQAITYSRLFEEILKFVHFSKPMNMHFASRLIFESKFPIICSKVLQKDVSLDISLLLPSAPNCNQFTTKSSASLCNFQRRSTISIERTFSGQ